MNNEAALQEIAGHMHAFNLGVGAKDHEALVARIAATLLRCEIDDWGDHHTIEHVEALGEQRPPANRAC